MKQYLFSGQHRLVRGRPLRITEEFLLANLDELKEKNKAGLIYVTLGNLTPFDLEKMASVAVVVRPAAPNFRPDSINNDLPVGLPVSRYGDSPPPDTFDMPVPPPDAAFGDEEDEPAVEEDEPAVEEKSSEATLDTRGKPGDAHRKKDRRR
jgi:hypothetical protein